MLTGLRTPDNHQACPLPSAEQRAITDSLSWEIDRLTTAAGQPTPTCTSVQYPVLQLDSSQVVSRKDPSRADPGTPHITAHSVLTHAAHPCPVPKQPLALNFLSGNHTCILPQNQNQTPQQRSSDSNASRRVLVACRPLSCQATPAAMTLTWAPAQAHIRRAGSRSGTIPVQPAGS